LETVFGGSASAAGRAQAGAAFNSLVNCFFVSLVALIPQAGLGVVAIIMSMISLLATVRLHGQVARQELQIVMLVLSLVTFGFQPVIGILLVINPGSTLRSTPWPTWRLLCLLSRSAAPGRWSRESTCGRPANPKRAGQLTRLRGIRPFTSRTLFRLK